VLAFAQPYIPAKDSVFISGAEKVAAIYIDNSFSMEAGKSYRTQLDIAKEKAIEIARGHSISDRFLLLTNDFYFTSTQLLNKQEFIAKVLQVTISPKHRNLSEVFSRIEADLNNIDSKSKTSYIISNFQTVFADFSNIKKVFYTTFLIPLKALLVSNIAIDSLWLETPYIQKGKLIDIHAKVKNYSEEAREKIPVELFVNDEQKAMTSCNLGPNAEEIVKMSFITTSSGILSCKAIIDDETVTYDDELFFTIHVAENIHVLAITQSSSPTPSIIALFKKDEFFDFSAIELSRMKQGLTSNKNLIIIDNIKEVTSGLTQELKSFVEKGGSVVVIPGIEICFDSYMQMLSSFSVNYYNKIQIAGLRVSELNTNSHVYKGVFETKQSGDVDYPVVKKYYTLSNVGTSLETSLIKLQNNDPLLISSKFENGNIYLFTVPFNNEFSNFHVHWLFVPTLYQIALLSQQPLMLYHTLGKNTPVEVNISDDRRTNPYQIRNQDNTISVIPQVQYAGNRTQLHTHNQIEKSGNYNLFFKDSLIDIISYNYSRKFSKLDFIEQFEIFEILKTLDLKNLYVLSSSKSIQQEITILTTGKKLWKIFLYFALLFVIIEIILLRITS